MIEAVEEEKPAEKEQSSASQACNPMQRNV